MKRLEVSCVVRPIYGSLGAKGLSCQLANVQEGYRAGVSKRSW
jgi:hypothetical protein